MKVTKAIFPVAGLGTRFLPATKANPKEMMPIFTRIYGKNRVVLPLLQYIFEQLYAINIKDYCFVVGREKRSIEDHFTPEKDYLDYLKKIDHNHHNLMNDLFKKIEASNIVWINQNSPRGFGAAILTAKEIVGSKPFLVHAGDAYVRGSSKSIVKLINAYKKSNSDVIFYIKQVPNPTSYGIVTTSHTNNGLYQFSGLEEKPKHPKTNLGIMPLYIFKPQIFDALSGIRPGVGNELQLTDAIQKLIENNKKVLAIPITRNEIEIDVGTVNSYRYAQDISYKKA